MHALASYFNAFLSNTPLLDFDAYYLLLQKIKLGLNPYTSGGMITLGPPTVLIYFFPFSFFKIEMARAISTFLNLSAGFILCYQLAKKYFPKSLKTSFIIFLGIFFSAFPTRFSVGMGQPEIIIALLITLTLTQKSKGSLLSFLVILKTFFIFAIIPYLRDKKVMRYFFVSLVLFIAISFLLIKPEWYLYYLRHVFPNLNNLPLPASGLDYYNQSLRSTFYRLGIIGLYPKLFILILIAGVIMVFVTQSFELAIISSLLLSPISWQHYYVALFPIFVVVFSKMAKNFKNLLLFGISLLLWWIELPAMHTAQLDLISGLLGSHFFISGAILYFLTWKRQKLV